MSAEEYFLVVINEVDEIKKVLCLLKKSVLHLSFANLNFSPDAHLNDIRQLVVPLLSQAETFLFDTATEHDVGPSLKSSHFILDVASKSIDSYLWNQKKTLIHEVNYASSELARFRHYVKDQHRVSEILACLSKQKERCSFIGIDNFADTVHALETIFEFQQDILKLVLDLELAVRLPVKMNLLIDAEENQNINDEELEVKEKAGDIKKVPEQLPHPGLSGEFYSEQIPEHNFHDDLSYESEQSDRQALEQYLRPYESDNESDDERILKRQCHVADESEQSDKQALEQYLRPHESNNESDDERILKRQCHVADESEQSDRQALEQYLRPHDSDSESDEDRILKRHCHVADEFEQMSEQCIHTDDDANMDVNMLSGSFSSTMSLKHMPLTPGSSIWSSDDDYQKIAADDRIDQRLSDMMVSASVVSNNDEELPEHGLGFCDELDSQQIPVKQYPTQGGFPYAIMLFKKCIREGDILRQYIANRREEISHEENKSFVARMVESVEVAIGFCGTYLGINVGRSGCAMLMKALLSFEACEFSCEEHKRAQMDTLVNALSNAYESSREFLIASYRKNLDLANSFGSKEAIADLEDVKSKMKSQLPEIISMELFLMDPSELIIRFKMHSQLQSQLAGDIAKHVSIRCKEAAACAEAAVLFSSAFEKDESDSIIGFLQDTEEKVSLEQQADGGLANLAARVEAIENLYTYLYLFLGANLKVWMHVYNKALQVNHLMENEDSRDALVMFNIKMDKELVELPRVVESVRCLKLLGKTFRTHAMLKIEFDYKMSKWVH